MAATTHKCQTSLSYLLLAETSLSLVGLCSALDFLTKPRPHPCTCGALWPCWCARCCVWLEGGSAELAKSLTAPAGPSPATAGTGHRGLFYFPSCSTPPPYQSLHSSPRLVLLLNSSILSLLLLVLWLSFNVCTMYVCSIAFTLQKSAATTFRIYKCFHESVKTAAAFVDAISISTVGQVTSQYYLSCRA